MGSSPVEHERDEIEEFMAEQAYHPYHLVDPSPWPLIGACGALFTTVGGVMYFHYSRS